MERRTLGDTVGSPAKLMALRGLQTAAYSRCVSSAQGFVRLLAPRASTIRWRRVPS
jgi:hypothetical protein